MIFSSILIDSEFQIKPLEKKIDKKTGRNGLRYTPYVIEPAAGATRGLLVYLLDAYHEEIVKDAKGNDTLRKVMKLILPYKTTFALHKAFKIALISLISKLFANNNVSRLLQQTITFNQHNFNVKKLNSLKVCCIHAIKN